MVGSEVPRENIGVYPYFEPFKGIERGIIFIEQISEVLTVSFHNVFCDRAYFLK